MDHQTVSVFFVLILLSYMLPRYKAYLPTIPLYPDSQKEALKVRKEIRERTMEERRLFELTDISVSYKFAEYVDEPAIELRRLTLQKKIYYPIFFFKYLLNRPRPFQVDPTIQPLHSETAHTPAFPSGHAYQAYYLAKVLSERYPHKSELFKTIADECAYARVAAGLHYPSDNVLSKALVDAFY